ncbi:MAG: oligoendopeptidase F [Gammaproteobacteria bacterium]|nr:oligoendopeptidase F [Gammaproteobacteria bacterium]
MNTVYRISRNNPVRGFCFVVFGAVALMSAVVSAEIDRADPKYTWDLTDIYPDVEAWDEARREVLDSLGEIRELKGSLGNNAASLLKASKLIWDTNRLAGRVFSYASLSADENLGDSTGQERRQLAQQMFSEFTQAQAWYQPELIAVGQRKIDRFFRAEPRLEEYRFPVMNILRNAPHTLGNEAEDILAAAGQVTGAPFNIYGVLANSDIPYDSITLSTGEEVVINAAGYSQHRASANRDDRKKVFDAYWGKWDEYKNVTGLTLASHLRGAHFQTKARNYEDSLTRNLFADNMPRDVYDTLVRVTNENLPTLHRYFKLRARMLGIEQMYYYDVYPDMVTTDRTFTIEDAMEMSTTGLSPLGEEYVNRMTQAFGDRWMHVFPQDGKRSGAYMNGFAYDVHPYILLNHVDDYSSVSTFAHEWGHAMHSVLANEAQPWQLASYATSTAETASVTNEVILQNYMLANARDDHERLFYLAQAMEQMRGTFFRQTMFSEFEGRIYKEIEEGRALSGDRISEVYGEIVRAYHGHDEEVVIVDDLYTNEWMFVPHFYFGFYTFQYATSMAAGTYFAEKIEAGEKGALEKYLDLLRAGGSDYPYELFLTAGLDLAKPDPYESLIRRFEKIMDDFEATLDRIEASR